MTRTNNRLVRKRTLSHFAKLTMASLAKWLSILHIKWSWIWAPLQSPMFQICQDFLDIQTVADCRFFLKAYAIWWKHTGTAFIFKKTMKRMGVSLFCFSFTIWKHHILGICVKIWWVLLVKIFKLSGLPFTWRKFYQVISPGSADDWILITLSGVFATLSGGKREWNQSSAPESRII